MMPIGKQHCCRVCACVCLLMGWRSWRMSLLVQLLDCVMTCARTASVLSSFLALSFLCCFANCAHFL
jgi:hypothetical protein